MKPYHKPLLWVVALAGLCACPPGLAEAQERPGERAERPDRGDQGDRGDRADRPDRPDRPPYVPGSLMERRERGRGEWGRGEWGRGEWSRGDADEEISAEKWSEIEKFLKTHTPERFKRLEEVPDDRREVVKRFMIRRYENLQQNREREPELYEIRLKRLQIEDEIFALGWQARDLPEGDALKQTRGRLRVQVRALVENSLQERRLRLEQATRRLEEAREKLKQEQRSMDAIVERHMKGLIEDNRWPALGESPMGDPRPPGERRGGGGGGGGGGPGHPRDGADRFAAPATQGE